MSTKVVTTVTMKNTVKEIVAELDKLTPQVQKLAKKSEEGKSVWDMFRYTSQSMKDGKKVLKADLLELVEMAVELLAKQVVTPVAADTKTEGKTKKDAPKKEAKPKKESSLKTKKKAVPDKQEADKEEPATEEKPKKKGLSKKSKTEEKPEKTKEEPKAKGEVTVDDLAAKFPQEFEDENYTYTRCDEVNTFDKLYEKVSDGALIFEAFYVTPEEKEQYAGGMVDTVDFPNDVDLLEIIYVGEKRKLFHAVSVYTEGVYTHCVHGNSMKPQKSLKGLRKSNVIWCLYEAEEK